MTHETLPHFCSTATGLESKLPFRCCAALLLCNISAQFHNFAECEPVPTQQWLQHFKLMLLPLLFQNQELYNSCPPVLQSEIQIISLLGGTIEISMNLTLCHWYWHRFVLHRLWQDSILQNTAKQNKSSARVSFILHGEPLMWSSWAAHVNSFRG